MRFILLLSIFVLGCGGGSSDTQTPKTEPGKGKATPNSPDRETLKVDMQQLALSLDISSQQTGAFAKDVNELKPFMEGAESLIARINSGKITVNWGARNPITWYAYETEGLKSGGLIAVRSEKLTDTVVQKTAEEIKKIVGK
jgi:hypothetical protein